MNPPWSTAWEKSAALFGLQSASGAWRALASSEIGLEPRRMLADVTVAGLPDDGVGVVGLLNHRAEQAGELGQFSRQNRLAELDIAERARPRIGKPGVRRGVEDRVGVGGEMRRRRHGASLLAGEVMEEGALCQASLGADVLDARRRIALCADDVDGGV